MKRSNLNEATALSAKLNEIEISIEYVKDAEHHPNYLGITLQGYYQAEDFKNACRQSVLTELDKRKHALIQAMIELGVYED